MAGDLISIPGGPAFPPLGENQVAPFAEVVVNKYAQEVTRALVLADIPGHEIGRWEREIEQDDGSKVTLPMTEDDWFEELHKHFGTAYEKGKDMTHEVYTRRQAVRMGIGVLLGKAQKERAKYLTPISPKQAMEMAAQD